MLCLNNPTCQTVEGRSLAALQRRVTLSCGSVSGSQSQATNEHEIPVLGYFNTTQV